MIDKSKIVQGILDELLKRNLISDIESRSLYQRYIQNSGLTFIQRTQSKVTDSSMLNECLIENGIDISLLFSMLDDTDNTLTRHQQLNEAILAGIRLENAKMSDRITVCEKKIKNNNYLIHYETFRDLSGFALQNEMLYDFQIAFFDKLIEAIKINPLNVNNILLGSNGSRMGKIEIDFQYSSAMAILKNRVNKLDNAIDPDMSTYWHECITTNTPIEIPYKSSVSDIKRGALCQLLITLDFISEFNMISITPFTEFPMEVVEIQYSTTDNEDDFIPMVYKPGTQIPDNKYLYNRSSTKTIDYQFANIKAKRVKVLLNQIHYAPNHFITKEENLQANGIFITDDKAGLVNELLAPIEKAIANNTFDVPIQRQQLSKDKLEYEYGLYNITLANNEYSPVSEYISTPFTMYRSSTVALSTNEEHYIRGDIWATSIEYELHADNKWTKIVPYGTTEIKWELLTTQQDTETLKMFSILRFPADLSVGSNIKVYKDEILVTKGYTMKDNSTIEFQEHDPYANYCVSYKLLNPIGATTYKMISDDDNVRLKAILKRNSRNYTGVTPILYDYTVQAINAPLMRGQENDLVRLVIIPDELNVSLNSHVKLETSDVPVLMSLIPSHDIVQMTVNDILELDTQEEE